MLIVFLLVIYNIIFSKKDNVESYFNIQNFDGGADYVANNKMESLLNERIGMVLGRSDYIANSQMAGQLNERSGMARTRTTSGMVTPSYQQRQQRQQRQQGQQGQQWQQRQQGQRQQRQQQQQTDEQYERLLGRADYAANSKIESLLNERSGMARTRTTSGMVTPSYQQRQQWKQRQQRKQRQQTDKQYKRPLRPTRASKGKGGT